MEYFRGHPESADAMWCMECASVERYCQGRGIDPGAGSRTLRPDVLRVDVRPQRSPAVLADAAMLPFAADVFDFVFTCHLLEHMADTTATVAEWLRVVRPGGHVVIVVPNTIYTRGMNSDPTPHLHEWSPAGVLFALSEKNTCEGVWNTARHVLTKLDARIVFAGEACPRWSIAVVLEKLGGRKADQRAWKGSADQRGGNAAA